MNNQILKFHLAGINNQNFIMKDEQTGSWWQQVTGEALFGPLKGQKLNLVHHDELSFALWKQEHPGGRVLRPDDSKPWKRFSENWEEQTAKLPVLPELNPDTSLSARTQVLGLRIGANSKAYPLSVIQQQSVLMDNIADTPIAIVTAHDKKSIRAFERRIDGQDIKLFAKADSWPLRLVDTQTGSEWDFSGKCVSGKYAGRTLKKVYSLKDYWFDWKAYNPDTSIYLQ